MPTLFESRSMASAFPPIRLPRNLDSRLTVLAREDAALQRLVRVASDPTECESVRNEAVRMLQAFLVLTPEKGENWVPVADADNGHAGWRRDLNPN